MFPKVSVIIPVYNDRLVVDAVESVLNQTYKNVEIIVIDDGSEPFVADILTPYLTNIRYYRTANKGAAAARNKGIEVAKGKYIAFLDADDIFLPNKVEKQVNAMISQSALFSYTGYQRFDCVTQKAVETIDFVNNLVLFPNIISGCRIATPTVMIDKAALRNSRLFLENLRFGEDVCAWIDISQEYTPICLHDILTIVRIDENTCADNILNLRKGVLNIINHVSEKYSNYPADVQKLIFFYASLYNNKNGETSIASDGFTEKTPQNTFSNNLRKTLKFYRKYGVKRTAQKIIEKLFQ